MATRIERDTAQAMIAKLQRELDDLYEEQEGSKSGTEEEMCRGGRVRRRPKRMQIGGGTPYVPRFDPNSLSLNPYQPSNDLSGTFSAGLTGYTDPNAVFGGDFNLASPRGNAFGRSSSGEAGGGFNWGDTAYTLGTAAPMLYNLFQGLKKPEQERASDFYNPYTGDILNTLRERRYDIDPILEANKMAQRMYSRDVISASGGSRGSLLGGFGAGMMGRQQADAAALSQASNVNAQYRADFANAQMGLGNQMAQTNLQVADWNARNRAARRGYLGQAASDLSGMLQTNRLMRNQQQRDTQLMDILPDMFSAVAPFMPWMQNIKP